MSWMCLQTYNLLPQHPDPEQVPVGHTPVAKSNGTSIITFLNILTAASMFILYSAEHILGAYLLLTCELSISQFYRKTRHGSLLLSMRLHTDSSISIMLSMKSSMFLILRTFNNLRLASKLVFRSALSRLI